MMPHLSIRPCVKALARALICTWLALLSPEARSAAASTPPNILLFIGDNWAWPHASALGDRLVKTPVFDRVAQEGVLFSNTFCPVPSCSPTRSSLLTGRAAHQLEDAASLWSGFPKKWRVFTEDLQGAGYETAFCGKGWSPGNYLNYGWSENPAGKQFQDFETFLAGRDSKKPFFFWLGNTDTALNKWHFNPTDWAGLNVDALTVPPMLPDVPDVRSTLLAYYSGVMQMDRAAGVAVSALEKLGLLENTVVIYTSDNGWQMPRGLANCYDTGSRVPLAVRWPNRFRAGHRTDSSVSLTDLAPTILEIAGLKPPPEMTGRSFVELLEGRPASVLRDAVFLERERHANVRKGDLSYPVRGIRTRDFLYLRNLRPDRWPAGDPELYWAVGDYGDVDPSPAKESILAHKDEPAGKRCYELSFGKRPAEELYDLRFDPQQLNNVAGQPDYAAAKHQLGERLDRWMRDTADPRVNPTCDDWDHYPYFGGKPKTKRS